jgi:hypothetical protein
MANRSDILCDNLTVKPSGGLGVTIVGQTGVLTAAEVNVGTTKIDAAGDVTMSGRFHGTGLPVWTEWTKTYVDFSAPTTQQTLTLGQLSADKDCVVLDVVTKCTSAFAGGSASAAYLHAGDDDGAGDDDRYITGSDSGVDCFATGYKGTLTANKGVGLDAQETTILTAGANLTATLAAVADNLDQLTQGSVAIYVRFYELP